MLFHDMIQNPDSQDVKHSASSNRLSAAPHLDEESISGFNLSTQDFAVVEA